jgi:hypothetical protein
MAPILLGDSILEWLFRQHRSLFDPLREEFCVGGQKASQLLSLFSKFRGKLKGQQVIVLIGTNDIPSELPLVNCVLHLRR